jgi:hypothetical protein
MDSHVLVEARREFARGDPERMARLSGSEYIWERQAVRLDYLHASYEVSWPDGKFSGDRASELSQDEEALLLQYLTQANGDPPVGRWLAYAELPNGMLHDAPFRADAVAPLARAFGDRPEQLVRAAEKLGGREIRLTGDAGVAVPALPRIILGVLVWRGDEEFPARANMLFDAAAPGHLTTAALHVLGANLSVYLQRAAAQE